MGGSSKRTRGRARSITRIILCVIVAGMISSISIAQVESPEETVRRRVQGFAIAWNRHDMPAFGALFADDADFVNVAGQWWRGRLEIQRRHAYTHGTIPREAVPEALPANHGIFKSSSYHFDRIDVRLKGSNVALAHAAWTMTGDARTAEPRRGMMTFMLSRNGDSWLFDAVQNTEIERSVR